ncbi:MAG: o-succinylbenzoate synthase [Bacteroidales bacterium]|nr:o-succinylbenzoate synthase [Bacteroidales bacterium]
MALQAVWKKKMLVFKTPARTSRGVMLHKASWIIRVTDTADPTKEGYGECSPLPGLSPDDRPDFEEILDRACSHTGTYNFSIDEIPHSFPSIRFGLETALLDLQQGGKQLWFPGNFTEGKEAISINGLIWMGNQTIMKKQIIRKMEEGYRVIKLKIGALDFKEELDLLHFVRKEFTEDHPEIRLDANGAFQPEEALEKLKRLSDYDIHSIEQPIRQGQWEEMAALCAFSPIPVALDEELIGLWQDTERNKMLDTIKPHYLILKPSLLGGFKACQKWIMLASKKNTGWWITSALESNIGLNAIAQWTYTLKNPLPQGLGTGRLYTNNFDSPLFIRHGHLYYNPSRKPTIRFS